MDFNARVRKLLGLEREKTTEERIFERLEEAKWQNTKRKLDAICESDDVDFEVTCTFIDYCDEEESYCNVSYNILPVYKQERKISKYEEMLNRLGLGNRRRNIQNGTSVESNKTELNILNQIIEGKSIEFQSTAYYSFIDDKLQLDIGYKAVIIDKEEDMDDDIFITLNIDSEGFKHKPDKKQTASIQKRMSSNKKQITIPEFIAAIEEGRAFKAAALNGNKNIDWESQQVFALDIDNDEKSVNKYGMLTPEDAVKRFNDLRVPPAFYYESFSSTKEKPKFRLIFIVKNPVTDIRIRNAIQIALMTIMPEADIACKDLSRLFYGTNKVCSEVQFDILLNPYTLIQGMLVHIKETSSNSNACKKVQKYCEKAKLNIVNGYPDVRLLEICENGKITPNSIIYNIELGTKFPGTIVFKFVEYNVLEKEAKVENKFRYDRAKNNMKCDEIKDFKYRLLEKKCRLWQEFISGSKWCKHEEVFGMACNMWRVRGAQKRMIAAIKNYDFYQDKENKINTIKCCSAYGYMPSRCANFCPYYESCSNKGLNILHSIDNTRGSIRLVEETATIDLGQAEEKLKQAFLQAYYEEGNTITLIKGATGIGKTTLLNSIPNFNYLSISYPNHRLGDDIVSRVKIENALHLKELSLTNKSVLNEFKRLQSIGAYKSARLYLEQYKKSIIEKHANGEIDKEEADKIVSSITGYFEDISKASNTKGTIFSTHKKMLELNNDNIKTYIIDEDILMSTIINTESLEISQINNYINLSNRYKAVTISECLSNLKKQVINAMNNPNEAFKVDKSDVDIEELNRIIQGECSNLKINLREILNISSVVSNENREVLGMAIGKLPDKKCIILSATVNEKMYRLLFPDRKIRFIDIGNIETEGELIIHYTGFSRNKLSKEFDKCIDKIKQETKGISNVITFAKFENKFRKAGFNSIAHFGACSGLDAYKGEDLIVAGTPHIDERVYILLASIMEENFKGNHVIKYSNVIRNGYEFYFNTFESSELLQEIQFYFIESELVQAVGRARILRNDAKVHLFSNYPIAGAKLYKKIA